MRLCGKGFFIEYTEDDSTGQISFPLLYNLNIFLCEVLAFYSVSLFFVNQFSLSSQKSTLDIHNRRDQIFTRFLKVQMSAIDFQKPKDSLEKLFLRKNPVGSDCFPRLVGNPPMGSHWFSEGVSEGFTPRKCTIYFQTWTLIVKWCTFQTSMVAT